MKPTQPRKPLILTEDLPKLPPVAPYNKKIDLVMACPTWSMILPTLRSMLKLAFHVKNAPYCNSIDVALDYRPGVDIARNQVLDMNPQGGPNMKPWGGRDYTHILWFDHDMEFEPWMFERLLSHDLDIVAGTYAIQDGSLALGAWNQDGDPHRIWHFRKGGLHEVAFSGFGFMLMKRGVIESLGNPPFRYRPQHYENMYLDYPSTEDTAVCMALRDAGFTIYVDADLRVPHHKVFPTIPQPPGEQRLDLSQYRG